MTDYEREEIARQVMEGYTSGRLDSEDGKHIAWSLILNEWSD